MVGYFVGNDFLDFLVLENFLEDFFDDFSEDVGFWVDQGEVGLLVGHEAMVGCFEGHD